MNAEAWDQRLGRGIFGLFLIILVFAALAFGGVDLWEFLVIQGLTAGLLVLWAARLWLNPKARFLLPPVTWCALAFGVYSIGRYLTCDIEYPGRLEFLQVMVCTCLFLAVVNNLFHQEMSQAIGFTLIILAMGAATYAICQYTAGWSQIWLVPSETPGRASGTFMSPDHFCGFLEMILPLALALLMAGRIKPLTRILLAYCILAILGGAAVTFSRAGWLAVIAGLVLVLLGLLGHRNHRRMAGVALALMAAGGTVFVTCFLSKTTGYLSRVADAQGHVNLDAFVRMKIWGDACRMWRDHWWFGVGPGLFDWRYDQYRSEDVQMRPQFAHCDYLNLLTDWGVAGGIIVAAAMIALLFGLVRVWPRVRRSESDLGGGMSNRHALFLGALGGLAAIAVHSLVDFSLHVPADDLVALTLLALLTSQLRFATERYWFKVRLPAKLAATVVLAGGAAWLGWQTFRLGGQERWLTQAARLPAYSLEQSKIRERAFQCEPMNFENAYAIGEGYRNAGLGDPDNGLAMLGIARDWYQRCEKLDPYYSLAPLREAQYLDLLGQTNAAWQCFNQAESLNPNYYFASANMGLHFLQTGQFAAAEPWLLRSLALKSSGNPIATAALAIVEKNLSDQAGNLP